MLRFTIRDWLWLAVVIGLATVVVHDRWATWATPIALDGYCPVTLVRDRQWQRGDLKWQTVYDGRKYLFASKSERELFLGMPGRFAPVCGGNDPVRLMDEKRRSPGYRSYGLTYDTRIYVFDSEQTMNTFSKNPLKYEQP